MTRKLFLISAAFLLAPSAAQAMDPLPREVIEHGIIPQMDSKTLENFGSTSTDNAAAVGKYRKDEEIPRDAVLSCPPVSEVIQALSGDIPKEIEEGETVTLINGQEEIGLENQKWQIRFGKNKSPHGSNTDLPDSLRNAKLMQITLDHRETDGGNQRISCFYRLPVSLQSKEYIAISRPLLASKWQVMFKTCQPTNPAYAENLTVTNLGTFPTFGEMISVQPNLGRFLPEDLKLICAQEKKV